MQNAYNTLHGGAVGSIAEIVAIACARTVVNQDKDLFLGELSVTYLAAAVCPVCIRASSFVTLFV